MQMTEIQAARAYALAKAHGHEWANIEENRGVLDTDTIRANTVAARGEYCMPGFEAPVMDGECGECVVHTTGTGRTTWRIEHDGTVHVFIARPNVIQHWAGIPTGTVIAFTALPDGTFADDPMVSPEARDRHLEAALDIALEIARLGGAGIHESYYMLEADLQSRIAQDPTDEQLALHLLTHWRQVSWRKSSRTSEPLSGLQML